MFKLEKSIIFLCLIITVPIAQGKPRQSVLLDTEGAPLSYETLMLLSSGTLPHKSISKGNENNNPVNTSPSSTIQKSQDKKSFRKSSISTPELEMELLNSLLVGQTARARQLIKMGVDVNYKNYKGETPLAVAVNKAWASTVLELIEKGAKVNQKNKNGVTLLHEASSRGFVDVAKVLMNHGLSPATVTDKKWTSLHVAARYGHWQLVNLYLSMGVDPNIRNSDGKTALDLARQLGHQGVVKILSRVTTANPYRQLLSKKSKKRNNRKKVNKR